MIAGFFYLIEFSFLLVRGSHVVCKSWNNEEHMVSNYSSFRSVLTMANDDLIKYGVLQFYENVK